MENHITPPKENGATRLVRIVCDIMIGERFFATFRGMVPQHPYMGRHGECNWGVDGEDVCAAIVERYPSLRKKEYRVCF